MPQLSLTGHAKSTNRTNKTHFLPQVNDRLAPNPSREPPRVGFASYVVLCHNLSTPKPTRMKFACAINSPPTTLPLKEVDRSLRPAVTIAASGARFLTSALLNVIDVTKVM